MLYILIGLAICACCCCVISSIGGGIMASSGDSYTFHPGMDSSKDDLKQVKGKTVDELKAECSRLAACKGFNTNGFLKTAIKPQDQWQKWSDDPKKGLYVKA